MALVSTIIGERIEYRAHDIALHLHQMGAMATVFDGKQVVYKAYGSTEVDALERARAWIDEQDEPLAEHDLHTG
jgi:hypothetical protein